VLDEVPAATIPPPVTTVWRATLLGLLLPGVGDVDPMLWIPLAACFAKFVVGAAQVANTTDAAAPWSALEVELAEHVATGALPLLSDVCSMLRIIVSELRRHETDVPLPQTLVTAALQRAQREWTISPDDPVHIRSFALWTRCGQFEHAFYAQHYAQVMGYALNVVLPFFLLWF
jgi:hypothetical protein